MRSNIAVDIVWILIVLTSKLTEIENMLIFTMQNDQSKARQNDIEEK